MDFFEIGVYLMIIVIAALCVFGVMWLLIKSMQPKKKSVRPHAAPALAASRTASKQITRGQADVPEDDIPVKGKKLKSEKKGKKGKKEKLLTVKELPDSMLLPAGEEAETQESIKPKREFLLEKQEEKAPAIKQVKLPEAAESMNQTAKPEEPLAAEEEESIEEISDAELPSIEADDKEGSADKQDAGDLMSVFDIDDTEESSNSDLAASLFDVDVENIEKLSNEVAGFLGGKKSRP